MDEITEGMRSDMWENDPLLLLGPASKFKQMAFGPPSFRREQFTLGSKNADDCGRRANDYNLEKVYNFSTSEAGIMGSHNAFHASRKKKTGERSGFMPHLLSTPYIRLTPRTSSSYLPHPH